MKKELTIALCSTIVFFSGCSKKSENSEASEASVTSKPAASEKASESPVPSESAEPVRKPEANAEATASTAASQPAQSTAASNSDPTGTYQIVSYDNGSGNKQTFIPGKDASIMGSSSIVLNQDGTCQFNLPGMSSDGCTWKGTQINTNGAQITYSLNGNEMTVQDAGGVYVFQKK